MDFGLYVAHVHSCSKTQVPKIFKVLNWKLRKYTTAIIIPGIHHCSVFFCVRGMFQKVHSYFIKLLERVCHIQIPVLLLDVCME
jgi:hypothetical protein